MLREQRLSLSSSVELNMHIVQPAADEVGEREGRGEAGGEAWVPTNFCIVKLKLKLHCCRT